MTELAYPVGHPAHPDYRGEPYTPPGVLVYADFPPGHPARDGKNVTDLDTPDGMRAAQMRQTNQLQTLASEGALPPLFDGFKKEPVALTPAQLAHLYAARKAYDPDQAPSLDAKQAVGYIMALGYGKDEAVQMFLSYAQPPKAA